MIVLAHAGHWLSSLLYVVPLLVVFGALGWQVRKDKREAAEGGGLGSNPEFDWDDDDV